MQTKSTPQNKREKAIGIPLDDGQKQKMLMFLAACTQDATVAIARWRAMAGTDSQAKMFRGNIEYWEHVLGAINWLADRVFHKQTYLLLEDKSELEEIIRQWQSLSER
jgi:hypothetical protein